MSINLDCHILFNLNVFGVFAWLANKVFVFYDFGKRFVVEIVLKNRLIIRFKIHREK